MKINTLYNTILHIYSILLCVLGLNNAEIFKRIRTHVKLFKITPLGPQTFWLVAVIFNRKVATGNFQSPGSMFHFLIEIMTHCRNNNPSFKTMTAYRLEIRTSPKPRKTKLQTHLTGLCKFSSTFSTWLPCEESISHRIISPSLLHTLRPMRVDGPTPYFEMCWLIFNIWKPKILGGQRSKGWKTLSAYPPFQ